MNDMKKIGLTALAGSLVAFSANAAEMISKWCYSVNLYIRRHYRSNW